MSRRSVTVDPLPDSYEKPLSRGRSHVIVLACRDCGRLVVAINDTRITKHKCAGAADVLLFADVRSEDVREALRRRSNA